MSDEQEVDNIDPETTPDTDESVESSATDGEEQIVKEEQEDVKIPPLHEHPRFKEVIAQKNQAAEEAARAREEANYYKGLAEANKTEVKPEDPYSGLSPEETAFYRNLDARTQKMIDKAVQETTKTYQSEIQSYQKMTAEVIAKDFKKSHPEIAEGSPEMEAITKKVQVFSKIMPMGEALEEARKSVMFDRNAQLAVEKLKTQTKVKTKQKSEANMETQSIPKESFVPRESTGAKITLDDLTRQAKELGMALP